MTDAKETPFTVVLIPLGVPTLDGRIVGDPDYDVPFRTLPLPVMWNGATAEQDDKCGHRHNHSTLAGQINSIDIEDDQLIGRGMADHPALRTQLEHGPVPVGVDLDVVGDWIPGEPVTRWMLAAVVAYGFQRGAWPQALMTKVG